MKAVIKRGVLPAIFLLGFLAAPLGAGQTAVVNALVRMPPTAGTYTIRFDMVQEGITWFSGQGVPTPATALVVR